jgi:hypothetical protein
VSGDEVTRSWGWGPALRARLTAALLAALSLLGVALATAAPASAAYACDGYWKYASWGRGCVNPPGWTGTGQTQDILTDGYCVEAKYYDPGDRAWHHITLSSNCGGGVSTWKTNDRLCIRMYNGDGHYLTLRKQATYCP